MQTCPRTPTATLFESMPLRHGPTVPNRILLAPMTNCQSYPNGVLSDDEFKWLTMRAAGGFGMTMTCAAHVQAVGQGFPGQLGVFSDIHLEGLTRLAATIKSFGSVSSCQLHHAGLKSPKELVGQPVAPSDDEKSGARALAGSEVEQLIEDFVAAAVRCDKAGFDGVELHGAHGYILCQFLSPTENRRADRYGGSLDNRTRIIHEIIEGIRARCRPDFQLGLRLSPERFGVVLPEIVEFASKILLDRRIDYLDMSLWDVGKEPEDVAFRGRSLMSYFAELERNEVRLGVAGKVYSAETAARSLDQGADFVMLGRAGILHHDFPKRARVDPEFEMRSLPVTADYLRSEGVGEAFIDYMRPWAGFVEAES